MIYFKKFIPSWQIVRLYFIIFSFIGLPLLITTINQQRDTRQKAAEHPILFGIDPGLSRWVGKPDQWELDQMNMIGQACGQVIRMGLDWAQIEKNAPSNGQHTYEWENFDRLVNAANNKGMQIIGLLTTAPQWADGNKPIDEVHKWPPLPEYEDDYRSFITAVVNRYRGKIKYYEVWNEANGCSWHPDCGGDKQTKVNEYLPLLKTTYETIKNIDSSLLVSTTGMDGADTDYLQKLYDGSNNYSCNGGTCWDAVAVHPYKSTEIDWNGLKNVYSIMNSKGDGGKQIWITEYGWNTTDEAKQAKHLTNTLTRLASNEFPYVTLASYLTLPDMPQVGVSHYGLTDQDLKPKPAYDAFKTFVCNQTGGPIPTTPPINPPSPLTNCTTYNNTNYTTVPVASTPLDRPANQHPDVNLQIRGWINTNAPKQLIDIAGQTDTRAPKLSTLLDKNSPTISSTYQVYNWNWTTGTKGQPISSTSNPKGYDVTLIGLQTTNGETVRLPDSGYEIYGVNLVNGKGQQAMVLYATPTSITLKYTREDNIINGYTIHIDGINVNQNLLNLYNQSNSAGRSELPAVYSCQILGTTQQGEVRVAIRDTGQFMDPRSKKDWWTNYTGSNPQIPPTNTPVSPATTPGSGGNNPQPLPIGSCQTNTSTNYSSLSIIPQPQLPPPHPDRPSDKPMSERAALHADYNLSQTLRNWQAVNQPRQLISTRQAGNVDPKAPKLSTLLTKQTAISSTFQVFDWNWPSDLKLPGTRGALLIKYPVTMIGLQTNSGDVIRFPNSGYKVDSQGQSGFILYASPTSITLKYTREDNVVDGYTIHIDGINVNPNLLNLYRNLNTNGRTSLPAIYPCQIIGTAAGNEVRVSIRDKGTFLDPRWAEDWWGTTVTNPTTPPNPSNNPQPTATPVAWINISIKDEAGNPVAPSSGEIYVERADAQTGTRISSDNQTLGQVNEENFVLQSPGVYKYNVKSSYLRYKFYAGLQPPAAITGFTVIDPGSTIVNGQPVKTRREDNGTPFTLATDQTKNINIVLRNNTGGAPTSAVTQQPTAIPAQTLNCSEIQGPDQIVIGDKANYIVKYAAPDRALLSGTLNAIKVGNLNPKLPSGWDWTSGTPKTINANSGILNFDWTPQSEGEYTLFCSAFSPNLAECRGATNTIDAPQSLCQGPGAWKTVKVISRAQGSDVDMCSYSQIVGHQVLTPQQTPLTIAAIAKPEFNVSSYTFSFLNVENNYKPVQFAAGTPFVITKNSPENWVTFQYSDMDRSDYNNNGQKPKQIKIQANFTADGIFSSSSAACAQTITIANPTNTPIPSPLPTQSGSPAPINIITIIAAAGVLIIIIVVGAFFLH